MAAKQTEAVQQLASLAGALKAPRILEAAGRWAEQARSAGWPFEDYLAAVLEASERPTPPSPGCGSTRPGAAQSSRPRTSTGTSSQPSGNRSPRWHSERFSSKRATSSYSALPAPARPTSPPRSPPIGGSGSGSPPPPHGPPASATRTDQGDRATSALRADHRRDVGYLLFEHDSANLFFQLVSSRYQHALLILTSYLPFSGWGTVLGGQVVAGAMIDRILHHGDVITLEGASAAAPASDATDTAD